MDNPDGEHPEYVEGTRDSSTGTDNNFTLAAKNGLEVDNRGDSFDGVGVVVGDILDSAEEVIGTSTMLPIGQGDKDKATGEHSCPRKQVVLMMESPVEIGGTRFWFTASNAVVVECAE